MSAPSKPEIERLTALAHAGAVQAAEAFAQLVGQPIEAIDPIVLDGPRANAAGDPEATGVFFELDGCLDAIVGIVFPARASEALVRRITGLESGELDETVVESAIMEVGNILASHVASAIADRLGERLLPSIPSLAMSHAQVELERLVERAVGADTVRIESGLANGEGSLSGCLFLVPTG